MRSLGFIILLLLSAMKLQAQCPIPSISLPDSICAGSPLSITNNSTGANSLLYNWDFNAGDLARTPVGSVIDTFPAEIQNSLGMDLAFQNDSIYGISIKNNGQLTRFDFGTDINNFPAVTSLGNAAMTFGGNDLVLENINGNWYGFTANFSSTVYRLDFGNSITNIPTATMLNTGASLNGPYYIDFVNDNGNYFLLAANINNGSISIINIGTNITNQNPTIVNYTAPGSAAISVTAANDCGNWYLFVGYVGSTFLTRYDFGSSLTNPVQNTVAISAPGGMAVRKIQTLRDNNKWYIAILSVPGDELKIYDFGESLNNTSPSIASLGGFNTLFYGNQTFAIKKYRSDFLGLAPNYVDGRLSKFKFTNPSAGDQITSSISIPSVQFTSPGKYLVEIAITDSINGLTVMANDSIVVIPAASPAFTFGNACVDKQIQFINTSTNGGSSITNVSWQFGDNTTGNGDTINHIYNQSGNYNVQLQVQVSNGCISSTTNSITVRKNPIAGFSFPEYTCAGTTVEFNDTSFSDDGAITNIEWNSGLSSGSGNLFQAIYNNGGDYITSQIVTTQYGCYDSIRAVVHIRYSPKVSFSINNTCIGETVQFSNTTTIDSIQSIQYNWDLGNTISSNSINPTQSYLPVDSSYTIHLKATAANGCADSLQKDLKIGSKANPYFTTSNTLICAGNSIAFLDSSYTQFNSDSISFLIWDFGDNQYDSTNTNPTHIYANPGTYNVKLTVRTFTSCDTSYSRTVNVLGSPVANFSASNVCFGNSVVIADNSTSSFGPLTNWEWDFGDSTSATGSNTTHLYGTPGAYHIMLSVYNQAGCKDTISKIIITHDLPQVNFGFGKACSGTAVSFTDSSTVNSGIVNDWAWAFGDNTGIFNTQNPSHVYSTSQLYTVTLIATSSFGCKDTISKPIAIKPSPAFSASVNGICKGLPSQLNYNAGPNQISQYNYYWTFGDGAFSFQQNTNHQYILAGNYQVTLTVTDLVNFCSSIDSTIAEVYSNPTAAFNADSICAGDTIKFIDQSQSQSGTISTYNWDFGAFGSSIVQNPSLPVTIAGNISTKLSVITQYGCKDSINKVIQSFPIPISNFSTSVASGTPPLPISFTNTSSGGSYFWDFGDGNISTAVNPLHTYTDTGTFSPSLIVVSDKGCRDSSDKTIYTFYPYRDLSIENLSFTKVNNVWKITCLLKNTGNIKIENCRLAIALQGKSPVYENASFSIEQGSLLNYTSSTEFLASDSENPGFLCIQIISLDNEADENESNNEKCTGNSSTFNISNLYPVPAVDYLQIGIGIPEAGNIQLGVWDITGRSIQIERTEQVNQGYNRKSISLAGISSGVYILKIVYNNKEISRRFIKQ